MKESRKKWSFEKRWLGLVVNISQQFKKKKDINSADKNGGKKWSVVRVVVISWKIFKIKSHKKKYINSAVVCYSDVLPILPKSICNLNLVFENMVCLQRKQMG